MFKIKSVKTQALTLALAGTVALSSVLGSGVASAAHLPPPGGPTVGSYLPQVPIREYVPPPTPRPEKPAVHIRSICDVSPIFCDPLLYEPVLWRGPGPLSEAAFTRLRILEKLPQVEAVTAAKVKGKVKTKAELKAAQKDGKTKIKTPGKTPGRTNPKAISPVPVPTS